jgi:arsenite methyltransferase
MEHSIMPSLSVMKILLKELMTNEQVPRTPEPTLVMDDVDQVEAYTQAGRESGVMAPVYLFHATQICQAIDSGDHVLDLACGPANQLCMIARLNPDCRFTGIDLSPTMLDQARALATEMGLSNVNFTAGSITDLSGFGDRSVDCIMSTMALHHLPDFDSLRCTMKESARILKDGGGLYLADFGRLKRGDSIEYFASQYKDRQHPLFTLDYLNSLHAAFTLQEYERACAEAFGRRAKVFSTWMVPYMLATRTPPRRALPPRLAQALGGIQADLPDYHKRDFSDLKTFFSLGGVKTPALG